MDILKWIDAELAEWVGQLCRVRSLLNERPSVAKPVAVIVPAQNAWPFSQKTGAYICQSGRYFQQISHIGFYSEGKVHREVPKILKRFNTITWTAEEIGTRMQTGTGDEKRIATVIKLSREAGWTADEYQLFLLTPPNCDEDSLGHVRLENDLPNQRKGQGKAWVRRQRYVGVGELREAKLLSDLDHH